MAFLGEGGAGGRWVGYGKKPRAAVVDAIRKARAELSGIKRLVELVESYQ